MIRGYRVVDSQVKIYAMTICPAYRFSASPPTLAKISEYASKLAAALDILSPGETVQSIAPRVRHIRSRERQEDGPCNKCEDKENDHEHLEVTKVHICVQSILIYLEGGQPPV